MLPFEGSRQVDAPLVYARRIRLVGDKVADLEQHDKILLLDEIGRRLVFNLLEAAAYKLYARRLLERVENAQIVHTARRYAIEDSQRRLKRKSKGFDLCCAQFETIKRTLFLSSRRHSAVTSSVDEAQSA